MNATYEKEMPYDLEVTMQAQKNLNSAVLVDGDDETSTRTIFVEVKATITDCKEFFEISHPQLKFADKEEENYHVIRVSNVGKIEEVKLLRLENLAQKLKEKTVKLCMVI